MRMIVNYLNYRSYDCELSFINMIMKIMIAKYQSNDYKPTIQVISYDFKLSKPLLYIIKVMMKSYQIIDINPHYQYHDYKLSKA